MTEIIPSRRATSLISAACIVAVVAALAGVLTLFARQRSAEAREGELRREELAKGPVVRAAKVELAPAERVVTLPAEVRAWQHATVYAKVSGYVKKLAFDKGDRVKRGQVLAELESPDLEQQLAAAEADLTLRAQQLKRIEALRPSGVSTEQEHDQAVQAVKTAQASLERARAQRQYLVLRAPFDGTVTARYADQGALLPAATGSTSSAQPLAEVADLDHLRVALQLAQEDAARVRVGDAVALQTDATTQPVQASVSRLSRSLDPRTRTMLAEIDLQRAPDGLYPGAFVQAALTLHGQQRPLVPIEALVGRSGKILVGVVESGRVKLTPVSLGVDDGKKVEIVQGLRGGELVALDLGPDLPDGAAVQVQQPPPPPQQRAQ